MWSDLQPFVVLGVALGGVFAMSGIGLVVLYRTTGVLNLAYGGIGATGALISWSIIDKGWSPWIGYPACVAFGGLITVLYGVTLAPLMSGRDPLTKTTATLGLLVALIGTMQLVWGRNAHSITLPTSYWNYQVGEVRISWTQILGVIFPILITAFTVVFLRRTKLGTAMRALANDREIASMLGVPVRRVEATAWLVSGLICGVAGLILANLVSLDIVGLSFLVVPSLAAALIGQLDKLWVTLAAGFVIGIIQSSLNSFQALAQYRALTPFVLAILALLTFTSGQQTQART